MKSAVGSTGSTHARESPPTGCVKVEARLCLVGPFVHSHPACRALTESLAPRTCSAWLLRMSDKASSDGSFAGQSVLHVAIGIPGDARHIPMLAMLPRCCSSMLYALFDCVTCHETRYVV